jgi:hypothetical protein
MCLMIACHLTLDDDVVMKTRIIQASAFRHAGAGEDPGERPGHEKSLGSR